MKKVIVACGGAVATSTVAANKIRELAKREGIPVEVSQCRVNELDSKKDGIDLIVTTARVRKDYGVPVIHGVAFVSGVNIAATEQKILDFFRISIGGRNEFNRTKGLYFNYFGYKTFRQDQRAQQGVEGDQRNDSQRSLYPRRRRTH